MKSNHSSNGYGHVRQLILAHKLLHYGIRDSHVRRLTGLSVYQMRLSDTPAGRTGRPCKSTKKLVDKPLNHSISSAFLSMVEDVRSLRNAPSGAPLLAQDVVAVFDGLFSRCPAAEGLYDPERLLTAAASYVSGEITLTACGVCSTRHVTVDASKGDRACPLCRHIMIANEESKEVATKGNHARKRGTPQFVTTSLGVRHHRLRNILDTGRTLV